MNITAYTDGGCSNGVGGFAAILIARRGDTIERELVLFGNAQNTTNNQMEIFAGIAVLEALTKPTALTIVTDSQYLKRGATEWIAGWMNNGWRNAARQPVANRELWERLLEAMKPHKITWEWVKGHADNPYNNRADELATRARQELEDGMVWCDWCNDRASTMNEPCEYCRKLGAEPEPGFRRVDFDMEAIR